MSSTINASIVGGTGYTGGELARILCGHPGVQIQEITSRAEAGKPVFRKHPNLRGHLDHCFVPPVELQPCDAIFLCMPHGEAARDIDRYLELAPMVIDLSADFRLRDPNRYQSWYGDEHPAPGRLADAVYGLPEINREQLHRARLISGVGCNATAMILALKPLADVGLIESALCDIKVGSSESGATASPGSHHPERSGAVRTYSPAGHRHSAEVIQAFGEIDLDVTVTAIEMVRGVLCTAHVRPTQEITDRQLWRCYSDAYANEPFVRIVRDRSGLHRLPDPNVLAGSNHADIGFSIDPRSGRIIVLSAIDNLVKGAAGSAVQAMNIAFGLSETEGLTFPGLHPA